MNIKNPDDISFSEITPPEDYFNRRNFMRAGVLAATAVASGLVYHRFNRGRPTRNAEVLPDLKDVVVPPASSQPSAAVAGDLKLTDYKDITNYNNFYEFSTDKYSVADRASGFNTQNWKIAVGGLVSKPREFDLDDLLKTSPPEERVYRMRCVEAWSMVIPWDGFSLSKLLERVQPLSSAKYVAFTTLLDPSRMPNQSEDVLNWPYVEGLRMDEAMHPLTILASGIYRKQLPAQDGAPVRLVVPWKYGFKGIKSIVKIELVDKQPLTSWNMRAPNEYGFYANVNPEVDHPRWSQAQERRIPESSERATLMFNGYADQVASLYHGMNLAVNF